MSVEVLSGARSAAAASGTFRWDDPFFREDQLTEDERMIRDTARAYVQEKLQPRVLEAYAHEKTDRAIFDEMGDVGLLGAPSVLFSRRPRTSPPDYGFGGRLPEFPIGKPSPAAEPRVRRLAAGGGSLERTRLRSESPGVLKN
jgi:hypothetical protein